MTNIQAWADEFADAALQFFGSKVACAVCKSRDDSAICSMVEYAWKLERIGKSPISVCGSCARNIANMYSYMHSGQADYDIDGEWPSPPRKACRTDRSLSHKTVMRIFERDGYRCKSCGSTSDLQPDHVLPISHGGGDEDANLQTLCRPCNLSKGNNVKWRGRKATFHDVA